MNVKVKQNRAAFLKHCTLFAFHIKSCISEYIIYGYFRRLNKEHASVSCRVEPCALNQPLSFVSASVHWPLRETLILNLYVLSSSVTMCICSPWEVKPDTQTLNVLFFPPFHRSITVIAGLHVNQPRWHFTSQTHTNLQIPVWIVPRYTTNSCHCVSVAPYLQNSVCKPTAS